MGNRTGKHDARGLALILQSGRFSRVHVKSVESDYFRALARQPQGVMQRKCIDLENEIRWLQALLKFLVPDSMLAPTRIGLAVYDAGVMGGCFHVPSSAACFGQ
ncbi:hypothetical protein EV130_105413 [Rhizobium azibense]|uniref:Transposase n=1 Tax=Rhizobium azibense TaxID=1136135 RepID=A0A4R3RWF1_9HYPH|nr:hypothetical protein EV130_105413 [Rhizobium azibense]TCU39961.1 hypothetical protein EV129_10298 [Rhizobium azibense]